jgi:hypothetical protein
MLVNVLNEKKHAFFFILAYFVSKFIQGAIPKKKLLKNISKTF